MSTEQWRHAGHVDFPVPVALAQLVPTLPVGEGWWYEMKLDGHRTVLWRTADAVRLQARSGRDVTSVWVDIAIAGNTEISRAALTSRVVALNISAPRSQPC
ncbi:hypothetical protein [Streptomyces peucetius]|uniref:ATP-dependent DNA ligase family profile domain-containing protein n=1 Tax=Streptomyces peucetius TaxID=1950 RepID=A0ABY6HZ99_STRPE|nr:hypothetical protein [Streptomyces peucetius]UYQ60035.1 hypothetical protein OGH68_00050 [Streptomyces peucetius]